MNERIREFALESRIAYYSKNSAYERADQGFSVIPSTQSLEKFAKLLIQDCLDTVRQEWYRVNNDETYEKDPRGVGLHVGIKSGLNMAINAISKQYGVEE